MWSAGCSSREEPYTIAMVLLNFGKFSDIKIAATDVNADVIDTAKAGIYSGRTLKAVGPVSLSKYFDLHVNNTYRVKDFVKEKIKFKVHNLLNDKPPETGFDIIFCRSAGI
ncbi:hypothetical protein LCGC14_2743730 [marine sediment metagenome]|uniref:CheR-type methyltransferase domain-containing protein n=1 Tax=marine sediment metagenome TaxID=412755 RepID=A0A0F8Z3V9_9ZZZZ